MKKIFIFLLILLVAIPFSTALSRREIANKLKDQTELNDIKEKANKVLQDWPYLKTLIGQNRRFQVRISSSKIGLILKNGKITEIWPDEPDNPTHYASTRYSTVQNIAEAEQPTTEALSAWFNGEIVIVDAPQCREHTDCKDNQVCQADGTCKNAFTLVMVPIGYSQSEFNTFKDQHANPEVSLLTRTAPINDIRVHYIDPKICANSKCYDACGDCQREAIRCAQRAGLASTATLIAAVTKDHLRTQLPNKEWLPICGCAGGIPALTSVSKSRYRGSRGIFCYGTVRHEMGHQLGLYHVNALGFEGGACLGPNSADCNHPKKMTDIMGYALPTDHFGPAAHAILKNYFNRWKK